MLRWTVIAISILFASNARAEYSGPAYLGAIAKLAAIPTAGPGAGICADYWVPSNLTTPAGATGSCSKISMCGISTAYTIQTASVGAGC